MASFARSRLGGTGASPDPGKVKPSRPSNRLTGGVGRCSIAAPTGLGARTLVLQGRGDNAKRQSRAIRAAAVAAAVFALFGGGALAFASDFEHPASHDTSQQ